MLNHAFAILIIGGVASCASQSVAPKSAAADACSLASPPRDAGVVSVHDKFAFVSPKSLPASYTGCQVMWDESGSRQYVARFAGGNLQEFSTYPAPAEKDKTVQVCRYASGKLVTPPPADCPSYDAMKGGIKVSASEPQVPSARDPRK
jgi:hypothetical protein